MDDPATVPAALIRPNIESGATLFVRTITQSPYIEVGFDQNGDFRPAIRLEPGLPGTLVVRAKEDAAAGARLPATIELRCTITQQLRGQTGTRNFDDTFVITASIVSRRMQPVEFAVEAPQAVELADFDPTRPDGAVATFATLLLSQATDEARYAGVPQRLRVTPRAELDGRSLEPAVSYTRLRYAAMGDWEDAVWRSGPHDIALPLVGHDGGLQRARLDIGVDQRELKELAREISTGVSWRGVLHLDMTVERLGEDGNILHTETHSADIRIAIDLALTLEVDVVGVGRASVRLSHPDETRRTRTAAYKRTLRAAGTVVQNNVQSQLQVLAAVDSLESGARIDLDVRVGNDGDWGQTILLHDLAIIDGVAEARVPFSDLLDEVGLMRPSASLPRMGELELSFTYRAENSDAVMKAIVEVPLEIETAAPQWLACIDLGTSSTAIWLGKANLSGHPGRPLPLGYWLSRFDPGHEEWAPDREDRDQILIPSHIGLGSTANLRARFDALSLGDLSLVGDDEKAVGRRLAALKRDYDLSVPFAPRSSIPDHVPHIIFDLKRKLIAPSERILTPGGVYRSDADGGVETTTEVVLADLISDYFDELGSYLVPQALQEPTRNADPRSHDLLTRWIDGLEGLGVVLTHPNGIPDARKVLYERAGRRFLAAMNGTSGAAGAPWVKLVPEALAAARFGIDETVGRLKIEDGYHTFGAIDIGAGTYDVTLIECLVRDRTVDSWTVRSHFGLTVGGLDLDRAIAERVRDVLQTAANQLRRDGLFEFELDLPSIAPDLHGQRDPVSRSRGQNFLHELQAAKQRLTADLLATSSYDWSENKDVRFDVQVGLAPQADWPVRATQQALAARDSRDIQINGFDATLVIERDAEGTSGIVLSLGAGVFEGRPPRPSHDDPRTVVEFVGEVLPALSVAELRRLGLPPPRWIVTGRAALWPPLYRAIQRTFAEEGESAGVMAREMPYRPDMMKQAVLLGAIGLAQEPHLHLGADVLNTLAVVVYGGAGEGAARTGTLDAPVVNSIRYIDDTRSAHGQFRLETRGRFAIVRALPGLDDAENRDHWLRLFHEMGVEPWVSLGQDIFPVRRRAGTDQSYMLSWQRRGSRIWITIVDEAIGETLRVGPIDCDGRIYGDF